MNKQFRRLTIADYDQIIEVWDIAGLPTRPNGRDGYDMIEVEMGRDTCAFIGVFDAGQMVGVTIVEYDGRRGWINRLAIDPDYRGQGLAVELIEQGEQFLAQYGEVVICALIEDMNTPSMGLFEKAGYVCEPSIKYWAKRPRADL